MCLWFGGWVEVLRTGSEDDWLSLRARVWRAEPGVDVGATVKVRVVVSPVRFISPTQRISLLVQ